MKFGKELRATVQNSLPEWRPMFMSYKTLKKGIHPLPPRPPRQAASCDGDVAGGDAGGDAGVGGSAGGDAGGSLELNKNGGAGAAGAGERPALAHAERVELARKNAAFFRDLIGEVEKVNAFFLDRQEDYVILAEQLERDVADAIRDPQPRARVLELKRRLVEFHGCLVLLDNYSHVNYQGFRKILKKHDKKTGLNIREAYLSAVVGTPFLLGDTVRRLLHSTEQLLEQLDSVSKFRRVGEPTAVATAAAATSTATAAPPAATAAAAPAAAAQVPTRASVEEPPARHSQPCSNHPPHQQQQSWQWASEAPLAAKAHPRARIGPESALYRTWRRASALVDTLASGPSRTAGGVIQNGDATAPDAVLSSASLQPLIDNLDAITSGELGIDRTFLRAVPRAVDYVIASTDALAMGFAVFGPRDSPLQLFRLSEAGLITTRLLRGRARITYLRPATSSSCSEETYAGEDAVESDGTGFHAEPGSAMNDLDGDAAEVGAMVDDFTHSTAANGGLNLGSHTGLGNSTMLIPPSAMKLVETRTGVASGPWPAATPVRVNECVQWTALDENVAVFYVMAPPFYGAELPCYDLNSERESPQSNGTLMSGEFSRPSYRATLRTRGLALERLRCW